MVHTHSVNVAWWAHRLADALPWKTDLDSLVRGALLHDYFLYDRHDNHGHSPHGFTHPRTALKNAEEDFDLNEKESDIILSHMWPLTIKPPEHKEGWLVTLADKIATWEETLGKRKGRKKKRPEKEKRQNLIHFHNRDLKLCRKKWKESATVRRFRFFPFLNEF